MPCVFLPRSDWLRLVTDENASDCTGVRLVNTDKQIRERWLGKEKTNLVKNKASLLASGHGKMYSNFMCVCVRACMRARARVRVWVCLCGAKIREKNKRGKLN